MSTVLIGVDVGGTTTRARVSVDGQPAADAEGPGAALRPERVLASSATIADVVRNALGAAGQRRAAVLVIGAAGAGRPQEQEELRSSLRSEGFAERIVVTTDIAIALEAAFGAGPGVVLTAGTGSVAVARDPGGTLRRSGGYGWQMGDEGSGYSIGRSALGAVGRAADGRSPATALTPRILLATRSADLDGLIRWCAKAGPSEVAALAPTVLEVAAAGDLTARGILDYAARELSQLVLFLLPHFGTEQMVEVACNGGLVAPGRPLYSVLKAKLEEQQRIHVSPKELEPVAGALAMAGRV
ncbi:MAG TPA: BadF/BadG/BcrA/BcrD ATPase family protein [Gemmatimonadales bacterium]|nr:BadF/BadG/BcrA/BcrD ATPase family protein [Gemmatimonadales bacterium]